MHEFEKTLEGALVKELLAKQVHIHAPDRNTLIFNGVPAHGEFYNKALTNLLIRRPRKGVPVPFVVCVDDDLEYTGDNTSIRQAFSAGVKREGWRMLYLGRRRESDFQAAVEQALAVLGFNGQEPVLAPAEAPASPSSDSGPLLVYGTNVSGDVREGNGEPTVGRLEIIGDVLSCLLSWGQARMPVIVGDSGVGKTNLMCGLAAAMNRHRPEMDVIAVDLAGMMAGTLFASEREALLVELLEAVRSSNAVVALEHLELALREVPHGALLLAKHLDAGARLVGTILPPYLPTFRGEPLARRLHIVELAELSPQDTLEVLLSLRKAISEHHRIALIDESCVRACVRVAANLEGPFPATAIAVLDSAAGRASLGAGLMGPDDVYFAADRYSETYMGEAP